MSDIDPLVDELANDPLGRGYAGMTAQQAADDLNAIIRTRPRTAVPASEVFARFVPAEYDAALAGGSGTMRRWEQSRRQR